MQQTDDDQATAAVRAAPRLRDQPLFFFGAAAVFIAAGGYWVPGVIFGGRSVSDVRGICNSGLGLLAQAGSQGAQAACTHASDWTAGLAILAVAGVIAAVAGVLRAQRHRG